jgi:hypothetical protein
MNKESLQVRSFLVSTQYRDKVRYPHPSSFQFELPLELRNVVGIHFRDYHFKRETLINQNNKTIVFRIDDNVTANITLTTGNYATIHDLLNELNDKLFAFNINFTIAPSSGKVSLVFTEDFFGTYVLAPAHPVLRLLGFTEAFCVYKGSVAPNVPAIVYENTATARNDYDIWRPSHMIVRITDVETILSNDPVTNRCSAVLFDTSSGTHATKQTTDTLFPLLQVQSRLQTLRIQLLNMDGDLYDTLQSDATFVLDFHMLPSKMNESFAC